MALCEELYFINIYLDRVGPGLEESTKKCFDAVQITFLGERRLSDESIGNCGALLSTSMSLFGSG